jgi:hypothetical protein
MPLPTSPTQRPGASKAAKAQTKSNNELAIKGILCTLIGLGVLLTPYFVTSPGMQNIVGKSSLVGWFALVLGVAFLGLYVRRRVNGPAKP